MVKATSLVGAASMMVPMALLSLSNAWGANELADARAHIEEAQKALEFLSGLVVEAAEEVRGSEG